MATDTIQKQLRGSSLLMFGRLFSMGLNLVVQVLIIRYLVRSDFGPFAYALALGELAASLCVFGLDKALARLGAIDHDRGDAARLLGTAASAAGIALAIGIVLITTVQLADDQLADLLRTDAPTISLLSVFVLLGPLMAIDAILTSLFGVLGRPRTIFFRRHVFGPTLKLIAVIGAIAIGGDAMTIAIAFTGAVAVGNLSYLAMLGPALRAEGLSASLLRPRWPSRQFIGHGAFMVVSDLVFLFHNSLVVLILGARSGDDEVAAFRAVQPFARLTTVVFATFSVLFVPTLSRYIGRRDREGITTSIHTTAMWVAVLSFPALAVMFGLSTPISRSVLGSEYADTALLLALLAVAFFVDSVLGIGSLALKTAGRVRAVLTIDVLVLIAAIIVAWVVTPRWGATAMALTIIGMLAVRAIASLAMVRVSLGATIAGATETPVYAAIIGAIGLLALVRIIAGGSLLVTAICAVVATLFVFNAARRAADIGELFPELTRIPVLGPFLSHRGGAR